MRILVTGGTGFLGKRLIQKLAEQGHDVSVFSRHMHDDIPDAESRKRSWTALLSNLG